jgi:hypothetical protein
MGRNTVGFWWWGQAGQGAGVDAGSRSRLGDRHRHRLRPTFLALEERRLPSALLSLTEPDTRTVINTDDSGVGSLRWAIDQANHDNSIRVIDFSSSVFDTPQTIALKSGDLEVKNYSLAIRGPAKGVTVSGDGRSRVFTVERGAYASMSNLTITEGSVQDYGGGVYNRGKLYLNHCTVTHNTSSGDGVDSYGGGLYNVGDLTLEYCTVSHNDVSGKEYFAPSFGGGIANYDGTVILNSCTVSANTAKVVGDGGGLYNNSAAFVTDCTFVGNSAAYGGGLCNNTNAALVSCTFTDNHSAYGGGVYAYRTLDIWDTIIAGNTGPKGGVDVYGHVHSGGNSNPKGGHDLVGNTSDSHGWVSTDQGGTDLTNVKKPGLLGLGSNGGPTQTVALSPDSPAIHKGIIWFHAGTKHVLTHDQRGLPLDRPDPDIGAFQVQRS